MTRVRVRGIYTTALTQRFCEAGLDVVAASPPICERFDADFPTREPDVDVWMTDDREGVGVSGTPDAVGDVRAVLAETGVDTFVWRDDAPRGAVFDATVERTLGSGAVVSLQGDEREGSVTEGFLPFDAADGYVEEGDERRVQVHDPSPPWRDDRPVVGTELQVAGALASLERAVDALVAGTPGGSADHELARTTEILPVDVPDAWGVRWQYAAEDAEMDALSDALSTLVDRADELGAAVAGADGSDAAADDESGGERRVAAPETTLWAWFGRETRFALDAARREVTDTLAGHHRVKAGHEGASAAVDFAEALGAAPDSFDFDAVTGQFGPTEGDRVAIQHGKPAGGCFTLGRGDVVDRTVEEDQITVRREMTGGGTYDALGVSRESGDTATTRFTEGNWWYPTVYRDDDGGGKGTYINVSTPVEIFPDAVRYVDLHVDVVKHADSSVDLVDEDELADAVDVGHVTEELANRALDVAERVRRAVE
jgi:protein associated with RNAse G/E